MGAAHVAGDSQSAAGSARAGSARKEHGTMSNRITLEAATAPTSARRGERHPAGLLWGIRRVLGQPSLLWPVVNARIHLRAARAPLSVRLQGRARVGGGGAITIGDRVRITATTAPVEILAWSGARVTIGDGTFVNYGVSIAAHQEVTIGRDCQIGQYAIINDNDYHSIEDKQRLPPSRPVVLGDRVWLGARVIVLKGVHIGDDAVIGAGSVVTRDVPARCVAVGMPARVVRRF